MGKTIIVSNRLPVNVKKQDKDYTFTPSAGGLVTGLSSIYKQGSSVWVGWPGIHLHTKEAKKIVKAKLKKENMHPVFMQEELFENFYSGFSNDTIWPLFHYFPTVATMEPHYWEAYVEANRMFCNEILSIAEEGDNVWVHDYHLYLLPQMLRESIPNLSIGFFQHIPFPSYEIFRVLPWRDEMLKGVIEADLIGFHTYDDMRHFLSSVSRILGYHHASGIIDTGAHQAKVDAFPMGIDYEKFAKAAESEPVKEKVKELQESLEGKKLILSVDRLDISKGIPEKLKAFEIFLEQNPDFHEKCEMMLVVVPSRTQVEAYQHLKTEIEQEVGRINGRFSRIDWSPIQYLYRSIDFNVLSAFYRQADVAFITSLRDGMNLVAKEYLASKTDGSGVLIISEMAGASRELSDALIINPTNLQQMANALKEAMGMPLEEQQLRNFTMQQRLKRNDVKHWAQLFMDKLKETQETRRKRTQRYMDEEIMAQIAEKYENSSKRAIILGFDGTLVPFVNDPYNASPDRETYELMMKLSTNPDNEIVIVSGRGRNVLDEWLHDLNVTIICEYGAWLKRPGKDWKQVMNAGTKWKDDFRPIFQDYADRTPGTFVEEKDFSLVWHYRRADVDFGRMRAFELINHLEYLISNKDLQILDDIKTVELKHASVKKSIAVDSWLKEGQYDFVMAAGAGNSYEDVFRVLQGRAITLKVGEFGSSEASYLVRNSKDVKRLLQHFLHPVEETAVGIAER